MFKVRRPNLTIRPAIARLSGPRRNFNAAPGGPFRRMLRCSSVTDRCGYAPSSRLACAKKSSPPTSPNLRLGPLSEFIYRFWQVRNITRLTRFLVCERLCTLHFRLAWLGPRAPTENEPCYAWHFYVLILHSFGALRVRFAASDCTMAFNSRNSRLNSRFSASSF